MKLNCDPLGGKAGRKAKREEFETMTIEMQDALAEELKSNLDVDKRRFGVLV